VYIIKVFPLATHAQNNGLKKPIEAAEYLTRRDLCKVPRANCLLYALKQCVLANALVAAQDERVIDFFVRALNSVRQPFYYVLCILRINSFHMLGPAPRFGRVAHFDHWRPV
jgi:hypothetical protein